MKKIIQSQKYMLPLLSLILGCFSSTAVLAADAKEIPHDTRPTLVLGPKGAVLKTWTKWRCPDSEDIIYENQENSLLWIELSGQYFQDPTLVSEILGPSGLRAGSNKVLLVDMDSTLRQYNTGAAQGDGFGEWLPPNHRLIDQMKNALNMGTSYVAIVTMSNSHPSELRQFISQNFPDQHHLIPIIFLAHHEDFNNIPASFYFFEFLYKKYHKNIHAGMALQIFLPFFSERPIQVALVDDVSEILSGFSKNAQEQIAFVNRHLPLIKKVFAFLPGEFVIEKQEGELTGDWIGAQQASEKIGEFLMSE